MEENDITTHVVAVTAIVKKKNKYLLAKRSSKDPQAGGEWSFPGGKVDDDSGAYIIEKTLKREVMEEVGLEIEDYVEFLCDSGFTRVSGHRVVMLTFICYYKSGEAQALEGQEEVHWLTIDEITEMKDSLPGYTWEKVEELIKHEKINHCNE